MANPLPPDDPGRRTSPESPWEQLQAFGQDLPTISPSMAHGPDTGNGLLNEPAAVGLPPGFQIELELQNEALRYSQRMAEGALERFSALFSNVPLALLVIDETGLILESNTMALHCLRPQETDPPLTFLLPLVLAADQARVAVGLEKAKSGPSVVLTKVRCHSGETAQLTVDLHLARVDNPQDDLANFICALVDQGPILQQIEQREALESHLRESQKMQAIGTLAGGIAHDFNNILAAILGNTQLARQQQAESALESVQLASNVLTSLEEIEKAALRARDLVSQILTFSRKAPLTLSLISLEPVMHESVRLMRIGLPAHIQLEAMADDHARPVMADATQVQQALLNLFQNAVQAFPSEPGKARNAVIRVRLSEGLAADGSTVLLTVSDNGAGMEDAVLARVFDPFFTTKPVGQGTGLGLSVVHGIMRAHGGNVEVISTAGEGTTFTLRFEAPRDSNRREAASLVVQPPPGSELHEPLGSFIAAKADKSPTSTALPSHGTLSGHLLYVDDDSALVFLMQRAFSRQGIRVTTCTDAQQALKLLADPAFDVQLLVSDFNMPGMDGLELLREARLIRPNLRMALASGFITPEIENSARTAGAVELIFKPSSLDELVPVIARLLNPDTAR